MSDERLREDDSTTLSRREAVAKLGMLGATACLAGLCANCLPGPLTTVAAAAEDKPEPRRVPQADVPPNSVASLTVGEFPVLLLHGVDTVEKQERHFWIAFHDKCTHTGCKIKYFPDDLRFQCPCHKSRFDRQGEVLKGPAKKPLKRMKFEVTDDAVLIYPKLAE